MKTTKMFVVLVALVTAFSVQVLPAVAQETTGPSQQQYSQEGQGEEFVGYGTVEFVGKLSDGARGYGLAISPDTGYYLEGDFDFDAYEGQRVYATGRIVYTSDRILRVQSLEAADENNGGREANFELKVEGTPPSGETFYAYAPDGYSQQLTDADDDGVYTGSLSFPTENYQAETKIPLSIGGLKDAVSGYTIREFGPVKVEDGQTFSATYAFGAGQGEGTTAEGTAAEGTFLEQTVAGQAATAPGTGEQQGGIFEEGGALGLLPDSGGTAIFALAAGALLVGGGLLAYRFTS